MVGATRGQGLRGKQSLDDEVAYVGGGTGYKVVRLERHHVAWLCFVCLLLDGGSRAHHGVA